MYIILFKWTTYTDKVKILHVKRLFGHNCLNVKSVTIVSTQ